jgi:hypothetical protein
MAHFVVIEEVKRELNQHDFALCLIFEVDYFDVG